jgi:hypothetical protein
MNNPDRVRDATSRLELTATKARAHSLRPATNQFAPTRYYTMPDEDVSKESLSSDDPWAGSSRGSQMLRSIRVGMRVVFACERGSASWRFTVLCREHCICTVFAKSNILPAAWTQYHVLEAPDSSIMTSDERLLTKCSKTLASGNSCAPLNNSRRT